MARHMAIVLCWGVVVMTRFRNTVSRTVSRRKRRASLFFLTTILFILLAPFTAGAQCEPNLGVHKLLEEKIEYTENKKSQTENDDQCPREDDSEDLKNGEYEYKVNIWSCLYESGKTESATEVFDVNFLGCMK